MNKTSYISIPVQTYIHLDGTTVEDKGLRVYTDPIIEGSQVSEKDNIVTVMIEGMI